MRKAIIIGHSHILCLRAAYRERLDGKTDPAFEFLLLREKQYQADGPVKQKAGPAALRRDPARGATSQVSGINTKAVRAKIKSTAADFGIICINGFSTASALCGGEAISYEDKLAHLTRVLDPNSPLRTWLEFLRPLLPPQTFLLPPPPPVAATQLQGLFSEERIERIAHLPLEPLEIRRSIWKRYCELAAQLGGEYGIHFLEPPASVFTPEGLLREECYGGDPMHGNPEYGFRVLSMLASVMAEGATAHRTPSTIHRTPRKTQRHPYVGLPDSAYWKQSVGDPAPGEVDPVTEVRFKIKPEDKVATAGSCFAQHISKRLRGGGFNFFVTEAPATDDEASRARGFYDFSARYGNVYTARQLVQLFDRAFGFFTPIEPVWRRDNTSFCDPFRPRIEPDGFPARKAVRAEMENHLKAVRRLFLELDVLVFTLGLTECWISRLDGAAYPMAPGVAGGVYDPDQYAFVNFGVAEVVADLKRFFEQLRLVNPKARAILTVSPVPLMATRSGQHVLAATTYSKSVLRVAAEETTRIFDHVYYFPSYEIITGPHAAGGYYGPDRRSVLDAGVDHVMRVFMSRLTESAAPAPQRTGPAPAVDNYFSEMEDLDQAACDEELYGKA
ncbi:GSCFA domain-containing protein [Methylomagnum ishizawai]|uniref:GSCFA domain-containing protein n=1 Tax=Methylomagnum ishizawai TaxID=1760988 RepID=UPI001C327F56|nr:GSCFA domain-containing protein [Methylomagnum ishizawai]BBL73629.1 hypothetical protein MishRS11D_07270 [Methylomagnum ishizawai]